MRNLIGYSMIFSTVILTVYGQLIIKWRVSLKGELPIGLFNKAHYFAKLLMDVWILSALIAAFIAALCWMAAMTKYELSYAYPFVSLGFALVVILSAVFFGESLTYAKITGIALIMLGITVCSL